MTGGEIAEKAAKKAAEKVPSWIERILVPSLNEIKGELRAINTRMDSLDGMIDSLDYKITSLRNEITVKFDSLEKACSCIT